MADLILDFGNARVKWFVPRTSAYGDFRHAFVELSDAQWRAVAGRGKPPTGFVRVNGTPFATGDAARRFAIPERPSGAARYRREYYGVGLASALASAFDSPRKPLKITLMATHAPGDIHYVNDLRASALGRWEVESHADVSLFDVRDVVTIDEPLAGFMDYTLTERGSARRNNPLENVTTLVVDCGGYTTDVAAIDEGGVIDQLSLKSTRTGVINVLMQFERDLREHYKRHFQDTREIDVRRLESALLAGAFPFGRDMLDCQSLAYENRMTLVNDVVQIINASGGVANYDVFLLTGGGSAFIADDLERMFPRARFLFAEQDRDLMKYANVFGGAKMLALLRAAQEV